MSVVTPAEARTELGLGATVTDDQLATVIAQAQASIETDTGPLEPTVFSQILLARNGVLMLPHPRNAVIASITSILYSPIDPAETQTLPGGVLWAPYLWIPDGPWTTTWTAGWGDELPADLARAVLEMTRHYWSQRRGSTMRPAGEQPQMGQNHDRPWRVAEIVARYPEIPGGVA